MNLLTLDFQGMAVHASRDAWFNATEIAEAYGKRLDKFWEREETKEYLDGLCEILNTPKTGDLNKPFNIKGYPQFIKTKRGKNGGTWLHPDLMVHFARWVNIRFGIWADQTIKALLLENTAWQTARHELKSVTKLKNRLLRDQRAAHGKTTQSHHFSNEALLEYEALTGKRHIVSRDLLDVTQIAALDAITAENTALIARDLSYQERKSRLLVFAKTLNYPPVQAHQRNAAKLRFDS